MIVLGLHLQSFYFSKWNFYQVESLSQNVWKVQVCSNFVSKLLLAFLVYNLSLMAPVTINFKSEDQICFLNSGPDWSTFWRNVSFLCYFDLFETNVNLQLLPNLQIVFNSVRILISHFHQKVTYYYHYLNFQYLWILAKSVWTNFFFVIDLVNSNQYHNCYNLRQNHNTNL